jgi:coenzyme F420-reducing hydrogenase delta subunit
MNRSTALPLDRSAAPWEPRLVAFCCHYCAYAAADLAGAMRLDYPPNVRIVRVPCTGRVDILHLLGAFLDGADGALVVGCLEGDCHFMRGNLKAVKRVARARALLDETGVGGARLEMHHASAAMGPKFVEIVQEMTERVRALGPNPARRLTEGGP